MAKAITVYLPPRGNILCGISGIVGASGQHQLISSMIAVQEHRGPGYNHFWTSPDCTLGHNRLRILDLSDSGRQPMESADGRYIITFNGEVYNYRELKDKIGPYPYRSATDTEVILAAYCKWGENCVEHFIGMFSFAIWDTCEKKLFCARDRLGIKPFNYAFKNGSFYFASEIKALLAAGIDTAPDWDTWKIYLQHGIYDHDETTFFAGVKSLPPGYILTWQDENLEINAYWSLSTCASETLTLSLEEAARQYRDLLVDSIHLRLRSDVPVGINLSGGLDSATLLSLVDQVANAETINSFTVSFNDTAYDEADHAQAVPCRKSWRRHISRVDAHDLWDSLHTLMWHEEAPYGGIGTLAYYKLFDLIDQHNVTVVLEGQGVDECLGGYAYYQQPHAPDLYQDGTSFLAMECLSEDIRTPIPAPIFQCPFAGDLNNRLYQDVRHTKLPRVLRMNDRLSMAFSKELREPFLDHRLVEFSFRLPDHYKIYNGVGKYLLRQIMKDILPPQILNSPKRAVVTPQREWVRGVLRQPILDIITSTSFRERGVFNPVQAEQHFKEFCEGEGENAFFIWQWINMESWFKVFHA